MANEGTLFRASNFYFVRLNRTIGVSRPRNRRMANDCALDAVGSMPWLGLKLKGQ